MRLVRFDLSSVKQVSEENHEDIFRSIYHKDARIGDSRLRGWLS